MRMHKVKLQCGARVLNRFCVKLKFCGNGNFKVVGIGRENETRALGKNNKSSALSSLQVRPPKLKRNSRKS